MAAAAAMLLTVAAFLILSAPPASAEIKTLSISDDRRTSILFEKFGFHRHGVVSISVDSAAAASLNPSLGAPSPSLLGFFLLSDDSLLSAIHHRRPPPEDSRAAAASAAGSGSAATCVLSSPYVIPLFTFADLANGHYNSSFPITHPDEYALVFANCAPESAVSMSVRTEMYNTLPDNSRDYLSVGQAPVPAIYTVFAVVYLVFLAGWFYLTVWQPKVSVNRIHHLMSGLLIARVLYCVSAAEDQHFIRTAGTPHGWDVMFYIFQAVKGVILFAVIALIGTGWSFLKPFLQDREKTVIMVVIPLQIAANAAAAVVGETGPFLQDWVTWNQIFLFVDVACCCAVLFPVVWSIRTLKETSKTDGKAAKNLSKLQLFRQFYMVVIGYLYFTRIIVYALKTITSYKYRWASVFAEEVATFAFYIFMFYMFRPAERNQYFSLDDEEEGAAEMVLRSEEAEFEL